MPPKSTNDMFLFQAGPKPAAQAEHHANTSPDDVDRLFRCPIDDYPIPNVQWDPVLCKAKIVPCPYAFIHLISFTLVKFLASYIIYFVTALLGGIWLGPSIGRALGTVVGGWVCFEFQRETVARTIVDKHLRVGIDAALQRAMILWMGGMVLMGVLEVGRWMGGWTVIA